MSVLVVGASGATGRLLVKELLDRGRRVKAVVRSPDGLPDAIRSHRALSIVHANLLELGDAEMARLVAGCSAIASCLGHTPNLRGIYGSPRRLVADATRRLCEAVQGAPSPRAVRFVLMNTAGNRDLGEPVSFGQRCVLGVVRVLLPPHSDNEKAAEYLRDDVGRDAAAIEWAAVRPDTLVDDADATGFEVHPSPTRSAIFDPGRTSRMNVARFMADLITDDATWSRWKGRMPVIYDSGHQPRPPHP